jgi:pimeloyl-ACP methyl ester carboxylesterase
MADQTSAPPEQLTSVGRGIKLCWQALGDPADPPILLVQGLGTQLIAWPPELCERLADAGFYVVRFDNRDIGRSTRLSDVPPPTNLRLLAKRFDPEQYDLDDMADDAAGLLDALELAPAHVVGVSMGGMIAQMLAVRRPDAVRSLTSIMSTTGGRRVGRPAHSTLRLLMSKPARDRDAAIERSVRMFRHIGSAGFPFDEARLRLMAGLSFDRGFNPAGSARQLAAILKSGDRTAQLARITAPTLVIHGDRDLMVNPTGGAATARAIPGARLETVIGMGHDLPEGAWHRLAELIVAHARAADGATLGADERVA